MTGLRRVVVTGVGMVSPLGAGVENVWRRLLNSESGIATIEGFDASHLPSTIGGEVPLLGGPKNLLRPWGDMLCNFFVKTHLYQ